MPRRVQKISRTLLDLTTTLILSRFPNIRALMVLSFGEVGDQGDARHCLVWAGKDNKVGMLAAHHSCTIRGGLPAATSNFAGLCLLHHAAWDRARYQSLEDLGGEGQRRAAADAVDVLVSARGFIQSKKGAAAFGGEKEALRAGVEKNDEVFEQAFDVIPSRLDPALFTTQQRSDGGEERNKRGRPLWMARKSRSPRPWGRERWRRHPTRKRRCASGLRTAAAGENAPCERKYLPAWTARCAGGEGTHRRHQRDGVDRLLPPSVQDHGGR
ncbi:unnamed protein product [Ectocarpus sp. 12 AP-2014]